MAYSCHYQISMNFVFQDHITTQREAGIWKLISHHLCPAHKCSVQCKTVTIYFLMRRSQFSLRQKQFVPCSKPIPKLMFKLGYSLASPPTSQTGTHLDKIWAGSFICTPCTEGIPYGILFMGEEWDRAVCEPCPANTPLSQICSRKPGDQIPQQLFLKKEKVYLTVIPVNKQDKRFP